MRVTRDDAARVGHPVGLMLAALSEAHPDQDMQTIVAMGFAALAILSVKVRGLDETREHFAELAAEAPALLAAGEALEAGALAVDVPTARDPRGGKHAPS